MGVVIFGKVDGEALKGLHFGVGEGGEVVLDEF